MVLDSGGNENSISSYGTSTWDYTGKVLDLGNNGILVVGATYGQLMSQIVKVITIYSYTNSLTIKSILILTASLTSWIMTTITMASMIVTKDS